MEKDEEILKNLCMTAGVSGYENEIREIIKNEFEKICENVEIDNFGNLIGKIKGENEKAKKIMIAAHMDEVGLMVKYIDKNGFINFVKIGGIDDRILPGQRVIIKSKKGDVFGIIGTKPPHLQKEEEKKKVIPHDEMFIDIGCKNEEEAKSKVEIGDPIIFEPNFGKFNGNLYYGKAVDNRVGCYALIKILEEIKKENLNFEIYGVASAQEEVGLKGARTAAFKIKPDYAIVIDTTIAGGTPHLKETESNLKIGNGVAITFVEASGRGVIVNEKLKEIFINTCKEKNIKYQFDVLEGGMTDGAIIYISNEGIPTGVLSIPSRYIHSPTGIFSMDDVNAC
ncbi:MAG: M42 family metallopeptidase, partial [Candidatus Altarchaeaceae archaeon]